MAIQMLSMTTLPLHSPPIPSLASAKLLIKRLIDVCHSCARRVRLGPINSPEIDFISARDLPPCHVYMLRN